MLELYKKQRNHRQDEKRKVFFLIEYRKQTKVITRLIPTNANHAINQQEIEARVNTYVQVTSNFVSSSHWLRNWRECFSTNIRV